MITVVFRSLLTFIVLLGNGFVVAQPNITSLDVELHGNTRPAKGHANTTPRDWIDGVYDSVPFDWYFKSELRAIIDSVYELRVVYNREREIDRMYYAYEISMSSKYLNFRRMFKTENNTDFFSIKAFIPVGSYMRFGYDFIYNIAQEDQQNNFIFAEVRYEFVKVSASFLDELVMFEYGVNPRINVTDAIDVGLTLNGIYFNDTFLWNNGITLNIKLL